MCVPERIIAPCPLPHRASLQNDLYNEWRSYYLDYNKLKRVLKVRHPDNMRSGRGSAARENITRRTPPGPQTWVAHSTTPSGVVYAAHKIGAFTSSVRATKIVCDASERHLLSVKCLRLNTHSVSGSETGPYDSTRMGCARRARVHRVAREGAR